MIKRGILFFVLCLVFVSSAKAIFMGTCEGYIYNITGQRVSGANVVVSVSGCSGDGCTGSYVSDSNGYYVVANLNLNPGGAVSVTAVKSSYDGSEAGIANAYSAAYINVTISRAPTAPTSLMNNATSHSTSARFSWISGTDLDGLPTHDQFQLDSNPIINPATSPLTQSFGFGSHTWKVKTCNTYKCSGWSTQPFTTTMPVPSQPTNLTDNATSHSTSARFSWTSGVDPANLTTYDEYRLDSEPIITPATSPLIANYSYGNHTWYVRTCNVYTCSGWASKSFSTSNSAPTAPTLVDIKPTEERTIYFNWTSGTDPDGDPKHDEFQLAVDANFITIINSSNNAISPIRIQQMAKDTIYYWRVRTCDDLGACSSWTTDDFFIYSCDKTTGECTCSCSNEIGSCSIVKLYSGNCTPKWECSDWSKCDEGITKRECYDKNGCISSFPQTIQKCVYEKNETIKNETAITKEIFVENPLPVRKNEFWLSLILFLLLFVSILLMLFFYKKDNDRIRELEKKLKERLVLDGFTEEDIKRLIK